MADWLVVFWPGHAQTNLRSNAGTLQFQYRNSQPVLPEPDVEHWRFRWLTDKPGRTFGEPNRWQRLGFDFWTSPNPRIRAVRVILPWWLLTPLAALPAAWQALAALRRRRRRRARLCPSCGYDLRATPGGCPECGGTASTREATG